MRVVVIGAGAAGSMAAIFAASAGAETLLLERTAEGGRKILISGGGRCNILPARLDETRFVTDSSPHTLRNIIRGWPLREQIAFFAQELRLPLAEETESGKLFPVSNKARDVRDGLLALAAQRGATFIPDTLVTGVTRESTGWRVISTTSPPFDADAVIIASGGLSVPKTGSEGFGLTLARALGHTVHPTYAALTPITAKPAPFGSLSGVSLPVTISAQSSGRGATATGGFLFTHRGYSGPAVLDISHIAVRDRATRLMVCWTAHDDEAWEALLTAGGGRQVNTVLRGELPERLALALLGVAGVEPTRTIAQLRREERRALIEVLVRGVLPWTGDEGYAKAEVTGGGVSLAEINPRTMESRKHPGLFLCGEMLDAFGPIGGYNFLWAWATGRAAGIGAATTRTGA